MNLLQLFLSQPLIQSCDVPAGLMDDWDIPAQGHVYACENQQAEQINDGAIVQFVDGYMWVHLAGGGSTVIIGKGYPSFAEADIAARERAILTGATYIVCSPSDNGGQH